jgi:antitoxin component of MazEF toxin-antitoxin module
MKLKVGSNGLFIPKNLLEMCGITDEVFIEISEENIKLSNKKIDPREGWDEQFEDAIVNSEIPENDMFEGMKNTFDNTEWTNFTTQA